MSGNSTNSTSSSNSTAFTDGLFTTFVIDLFTNPSPETVLKYPGILLVIFALTLLPIFLGKLIENVMSAKVFVRTSN